MSTQISANISPETRELLEKYVATHGVKKSHLIETAVLHHLKALDEIPVDLHIPPEIEISRKSGELGDVQLSDQRMDHFSFVDRRAFEATLIIVG